MAVEFTDANFEELALKSDKPVLVDFWAEWLDHWLKRLQMNMMEKL